MKDDFVAARAVRNQMHKINEIDLYNVDCYAVNGETGVQMIEWVKKALETNSFACHPVSWSERRKCVECVRAGTQPAPAFL
jgi:hypothetical protein